MADRPQRSPKCSFQGIFESNEGFVTGDCNGEELASPFVQAEATSIHTGRPLNITHSQHNVKSLKDHYIYALYLIQGILS